MRAAAAFIREHAASFFAPATTCPCLAHKRSCPLTPARENLHADGLSPSLSPHPPGAASAAVFPTLLDSQPADEDHEQFHAGMAALNDEEHEQFNAAMAALNDEADGGTGGGGEEEPEQRQCLIVNTASTTCIGLSSAGRQQHQADPSEKEHAIWLEERRHLASTGREDMFMAENVREYPAHAKLVTDLHETHHILHIRASPQDLYLLAPITNTWGGGEPKISLCVIAFTLCPEEHGWPCRRPRIFTVGLSRRTLRWTGALDYGRAFLEEFGCSPSIGGDCFFRGSQQHYRIQEWRYMAEQRGVFLPPGTDSIGGLDELLQVCAPGMRRIGEKYQERSEQPRYTGQDFIADWRQDADEEGKILKKKKDKKQQR